MEMTKAMRDIGDPSDGECYPPAITIERRRDLINIAVTILDALLVQVQPHELRFVRRAMDMLIGNP